MEFMAKEGGKESAEERKEGKRVTEGRKEGGKEWLKEEKREGKSVEGRKEGERERGWLKEERKGQITDKQNNQTIAGMRREDEGREDRLPCLAPAQGL